MGASKAVLFAAALALPSACLRRAGEAGDSAGGAAIELHDKRGYVTFTLRPTAQGAVFVDHATSMEGRLFRGDAAGVVTASAGGSSFEARPGRDGALEIRGPAGVALRLGRVDGTLRIADGSEIPRGRVRRDGDAFVAHDAAGAVVAQARSEGGRVTVSDRNGTALGFVTGPVTAERAAAAFLPGLRPVERALLLEATRPSER